MLRIQTIRIAKDISITSPWPAIFLEKENALLVADLHIGLEDEHESRGIHIPATILPKIIESVVSPAKQLGCSKVIILGDVKHEFGRPREPEWWGVKKLFNTIRENRCEVEVVRGNHDNYIIVLLKEFGVTLYDPSMLMGSHLLIHGHIKPAGFGRKVRYIVMGHEHPAITLKDGVGVKHRFKAFITGCLRNTKVIVLPSVSPLTIGSDVNELPREKLFSPLLHEADVQEFTPYLIEPGVVVKKFPKIRYLEAARRMERLMRHCLTAYPP